MRNCVFDLAIERSETEAIVHVLGEIDAFAAADLDDALWTLALLDLPSLVLDLTDCFYVDSAFFDVLVRHARHFAGRIRVIAPAHGFVRRLFAITRFDATFPVLPRL